MDGGSVSTIGNDTMVSRRWNPRKIRVSTGSSPGSRIRVSEQSYTAMDSRVFEMEQKISSMELNVKNSVNKSIEAMLNKIIEKNIVGRKFDD